ncbi:hypothetical protein IHE45_20G006400 [Dioscorea alata]|uniref:Uncharacterized protein n=1 Tax=Dioscorea alata TaxID=55571 RepID=A0ACB7TS57_DIOAL|nr:hypothetical protein IHE45_20G006400 [Dioscorea alata]
MCVVIQFCGIKLPTCLIRKIGNSFCLVLSLLGVALCMI